ncbi:MAG: phosphate signaling complex protein PhoU [Paracoccaceae bacterium]
MTERLHIDQAFDKDLEKIREAILMMGGHVEHAIAQAADALEARDEDLARQVVEGDKRIDEIEEEIDQSVVSLLALRQPQAGDLRAVISVMKMASELERLGDLAKNMGKRVPVLATSVEIEGAGAAIRRQARQVAQMLRDALDSFAQLDMALATEAITRDVDVDHMTNALFREFITHMMEDPRKISPCLHYLFIAKNVERMGDHVTSLAEHVIYLASGSKVAARPKGSSTSSVHIAPEDTVRR